MFQEGPDAATQSAFREIARLTGGAYAAFDAARRAGWRSCSPPPPLMPSAVDWSWSERAGEGEDAARLLLSQMG